jgi:hypothetical protein
LCMKVHKASGTWLQVRLVLQNILPQSHRVCSTSVHRWSRFLALLHDTWIWTNGKTFN